MIGEASLYLSAILAAKTKVRCDRLAVHLQSSQVNLQCREQERRSEAALFENATGIFEDSVDFRS